MNKYMERQCILMIKEARLWKPEGEENVECFACARRCKIPNGSYGFCYLRQNVKGKLYLNSYGRLAAVQLDPIEKKPFNHFMPGSYVLGVGTLSCNFGCKFCQNPEISKRRCEVGIELLPKDAVARALNDGAQGMAYTYNEPTIFIEYALDTAKIAHKKGLFNVFVTNGYMTKEAVREMKGLIDAVVVDFKGSGEQSFVRKYCGILSSDPIKEALRELKKVGIHVEITDLVVPGVGDSLEACRNLTRWLHDELGEDTPIHFTRFFPNYKMLDVPETDYDSLKAHYDIAKRNGLNYVYIGNDPGNHYESTYCPKCGELVIGRYGLNLTEWKLDSENRCPACKNTIPVVGKPPKKST